MSDSWEEEAIRRRQAHIRGLVDDVSKTIITIAAIAGTTVALVVLVLAIQRGVMNSRNKEADERKTRLESCKTITEETARAFCIVQGGQ